MGHTLSSLYSKLTRPKSTSRTNMAPIEQPQLPNVQTQLLLHQPRSPYETFHEGGVPVLTPGELLVQVEAIGLNPIDWKSA